MSTLASVILEGVASALPSAGIPGRLYFATDTDVVYRDNGTAFVAVNTGGGGGGGSTPFSTPPTTGLASPNGGTTYTLPSASANPTASFYFVNGNKKIYGLSYTISGTTLTLIGTLASGPPNTGDTHELYYS